MFRSAFFASAVAFAAAVQPLAAANSAASSPPIPTLFVVGDSTSLALNGVLLQGWGEPFAAYFDRAKIAVASHMLDGRSSRTYLTGGDWDTLLTAVDEGDTVLIQFGHYDDGAINDNRFARGTLAGIGDETQGIENPVTQKHEVVHTFGWYLRKMIADVRTKKATPVLLSPTPRNLWKEGKIVREPEQFREWTRAQAEAEKAQFIDVTSLVADRFDQLGEKGAKALFRDSQHLSEAGARVVAEVTLAGLKGLRENAYNSRLKPSGRAIVAAPPTAVWVPTQPPPRGTGGDRTEFMRWLNLPDMADPSRPSLFLIGDSTVRNGRGNGYDAQFGWGDPLENYFNPAKLNVVNRAVGGTGVRSFIASGYWDSVLALMKRGDTVLMQFGHNDNGPRGPLPGVGEETEERENPQTKEKETIHTFGWYLRKYVADTRAKGATPVICSLVPRKTWKDGKIARNKGTHAGWAEAVAKSERAGFIDLNELIAQRYDALGEKAVDPLFADRGVHTSWEGAKLSAAVVIAGLEALPKNPVAAYRRSEK